MPDASSDQPVRSLSPGSVAAVKFDRSQSAPVVSRGGYYICCRSTAMGGVCMFESAELGHSISDGKYDREMLKLRAALLKAQYDLPQDKSFPVIIIIGGVDGAGKGETVNVLNEWMDPRHIVTHAFGEMSDEERERPRMWRYWRALPPKGHIGILFGAWHTDPIVNRVMGKISNAQLELAMEEIVRFERMLVDE